MEDVALAPGVIRWNNMDVPVPSVDPSLRADVYHRNEFFRRAFSYLQFNEIGGDYAEFGSASATTFRLVWNTMRAFVRPTKLWAFDGFQGLPPPQEIDFHPKWTLGNYPTPLDLFIQIIELHGIPRSDYEIIPGFYSDTIGSSASDHPEWAPDVALAYVDCDLYSSTRDVLFFLRSRLKHGMIIAFDDYFCYSINQIAGERLALLEFIQENPDWDFVPFGNIDWHGQAFIVESKSLRIRTPVG